MRSKEAPKKLLDERGALVRAFADLRRPKWCGERTFAKEVATASGDWKRVPRGCGIARRDWKLRRGWARLSCAGQVDPRVCVWLFVIDVLFIGGRKMRRATGTRTEFQVDQLWNFCGCYVVVLWVFAAKLPPGILRCHAARRLRLRFESDAVEGGQSTLAEAKRKRARRRNDCVMRCR